MVPNIRLRQSMCIYLKKTILPNFTPIRFETTQHDWALALYEDRLPNKNNKKKKKNKNNNN